MFHILHITDISHDHTFDLVTVFAGMVVWPKTNNNLFNGIQGCDMHRIENKMSYSVTDCSEMLKLN